MRKIHTPIALILSLALMMAMIPLTSFAAEGDIENQVKTVKFTDSGGKDISLDYDYFKKSFKNFPVEGSKILIFYNTNTSGKADKEYTYTNGMFTNASIDTNPDLSPFHYSITGDDYRNSTVTMRLYEEKDIFNYAKGFVYDHTCRIDVTPARAPMKSFTYSPSLINIPAESIKMKDASGNTIYNLKNRAVHTVKNKKTWKSAFSSGETITVWFADGTSKVFTNKDILAENTYTDYFIGDDGERIWPQALSSSNYLMKIGMNEVPLCLMNQSKDITAVWKVYVKQAGEADYTEPEGNTANTSTAGSNAIKTDTEQINKNTRQPVKVAKVKKVNAVRTGKRIKIRWNALSKKELKNASKIQIQYSRNKNFKKGKTVSVYVKKTKKSYTTKKLNRGIYYTRARNVRSLNGRKYYSKWSTVKSVKIR